MSDDDKVMFLALIVAVIALLSAASDIIDDIGDE